MILFIGPVFPAYFIHNHPTISPAANNWCVHFVTELMKYEDCVCLYHINQPLFPKAKPYIFSEKVGNSNIFIKTIPYLNVPFLRSFSLYLSYKKKIGKILKNKSVTHIITYNTQLAKVAEYFKNKGLKWDCIYADASTQNQLMSRADNHIYFSYDSFKSAIYEKKYHFEGAIYNRGKENFKISNSKIFLYSGAIREENGVSLMLDAFNSISNLDVELWICGKGTYSEFAKKKNKDKRVKFWGLVDDDTLQNLYSQAFCFLNPRLSFYKENSNNFPSKLLDYLAYGKPIISTFTKGISPNYKPYLTIVTNESVKGFSSAMTEVLSYSDAQLKEIYDQIMKYGQEKNNWENKVKKLWKFIN